MRRGIGWCRSMSRTPCPRAGRVRFRPAPRRSPRWSAKRSTPPSDRSSPRRPRARSHRCCSCNTRRPAPRRPPLSDAAPPRREASGPPAARTPRAGRDGPCTSSCIRAHCHGWRRTPPLPPRCFAVPAHSLCPTAPARIAPCGRVLATDACCSSCRKASCCLRPRYA